MSQNNLQEGNDSTPQVPGEPEGFQLDWLIRENIKSLAPYTTARHEFTGHASVMLDANENAIGSPVILETGDLHESLNRYPDPMQMALKKESAR